MQYLHEDVSRGTFEAFVRKAKAAQIELHAVELYENNECKVRWEFSPYSVDARAECYSLSKLFTGAAAGVAFTKGLLRPEDHLADYYPTEIATAIQKDPRWEKMRVEHLLTMTTGHQKCVMPAMAFAPDSAAAFFKSELSFEPGSHFVYNTGASCMLAAVVEKATGQTVPDLLAREIFAPMGLEPPQWGRTADGHCLGGVGLRASCSDFARLGLLYLNGGFWEGKRILSEDWIAQAGTKHVDTCVSGRPDWNAGYGYHVWMNAKEGYRADGSFGQFCLILPQRAQIVAITAESGDMDTELRLIWEWLDHLHGDAALTASCAEMDYLPQKGNWDGNLYDTDWMDCIPNETGLTRLRLQKDDTQIVLSFRDGASEQSICARYGKWTENRVCVRQAKPLLREMMPRSQPEMLHFVCAGSLESEGFTLECRGLDTPHHIMIHCVPENGGWSIHTESPYQRFGLALNTLHCRNIL